MYQSTSLDDGYVGTLFEIYIEDGSEDSEAPTSLIRIEDWIGITYGVKYKGNIYKTN